MDQQGNIQADRTISEKDKAELDKILRERFLEKLRIPNKNKLTVVYEERSEDNEDYADNYNKNQGSKFEIISGGEGSTFYYSDSTSLKSHTSSGSHLFGRQSNKLG